MYPGSLHLRYVGIVERTHLQVLLEEAQVGLVDLLDVGRQGEGRRSGLHLHMGSDETEVAESKHARGLHDIYANRSRSNTSAPLRKSSIPFHHCASPLADIEGKEREKAAHLRHVLEPHGPLASGGWGVDTDHGLEPAVEQPRRHAAVPGLV